MTEQNTPAIHPIPQGSGHYHPDVVEKVEGLFHVIPFKTLRQTNKVDFHAVPFLPGMNGLDRVVHQQDAFSPGAVGEIERPWYMHPAQDDNLITLQGRRVVELYSKSHGKREIFEISPDRILWDGKIILEGPGILGWPPGVFHRNHSPYVGGSVSMNLAIRFDGFDLRTEFNIYDLDEATGDYWVIREGHQDQPKG